MNIDIEDNVPMPDDGWITGKTHGSKELDTDAAKLRALGGDPGSTFADVFNPPQPGPNDCTFVGGPLNGKFGPLRDNDKKIVEIEIYNADGSVASVELYALGDMHPTPTFRYHVGSKEP